MKIFVILASVVMAEAAISKYLIRNPYADCYSNHILDQFCVKTTDRYTHIRQNCKSTNKDECAKTEAGEPCTKCKQNSGRLCGSKINYHHGTVNMCKGDGKCIYFDAYKTSYCVSKMAKEDTRRRRHCTDNRCSRMKCTIDQDYGSLRKKCGIRKIVTTNLNCANGCCKQCAKLKGEECGGYLDEFGICDDTLNLKCHRDAKYRMTRFSGTCIEESANPAAEAMK